MIPHSEIEYKRVNSLRSGYERKYAMLIRALLNRQFKAVASAVTESNYSQPPVSVINDRDMAKLFTSLYSAVGVQFARDTYRNRKAQGNEEIIDHWEQYMREYAMSKAGARIVSINNVTKEQIRRITGSVVEVATAEGLGTAETARRLRDALKAQGEEINRWRALRIARTEVMTASNAGSLRGAKDLNVPMDKIWIATMDQRTRDVHAAMNNVAVDINDDFELIDGAKMDGPGDDAGGPGNVINCRCTIAYKVKR